MRAQDIARWRANLQGEVDGIAIYRAMADAEPQPALGAVYRKLAEAEARHSALWGVASAPPHDDVRPFARTQTRTSMRSMTVGIEPIVWTAATLLVLAALAFVAELLPPFLLHESRSVPSPADRSNVVNGRVVCRIQGADVDVDECVGCPHLRVLDGRGTFIVCDSRAAAAVA